MKFTKQSIVSIEIPTADVKRSIFNSVLTILKISRSTLTDIYTNKNTAEHCYQIIRIYKNILDLISILVLLNMHKDVNVITYSNSYLF